MWVKQPNFRLLLSSAYVFYILATLFLITKLRFLHHEPNQLSVIQAVFVCSLLL